MNREMIIFGEFYKVKQFSGDQADTYNNMEVHYFGTL